MKLKVLAYRPHPHQWHLCETESGEKIRVDLLINGDFPEETTDESLVGKVVSVDSIYGYEFIARGVKIL